jgi:hypothetical protein
MSLDLMGIDTDYCTDTGMLTTIDIADTNTADTVTPLIQTLKIPTLLTRPNIMLLDTADAQFHAAIT